MNVPMSGHRLASGVFLALVLAFFYGPMVSVVVFSFSASPIPNVWAGFTLHWYADLLHDAELLRAGAISVMLALATAFTAVVIGAWIGYVLATYARFRGRTLFSAMVNAPMVLPEVVSGISLLLLFVALEQLIGWPAGRGLTTMWLGHVMLCISYVAITVQARLAAMDPSLVEAARDLGASPFAAFRDVTLPLIAPALASGWLLSVTISLDDVIMSAFLSGPDTTTLPLVVLSRMRIGLDPKINALGTLFIAVVSLVVVSHAVWLMRREQRRARDRSRALREPALPAGPPRPGDDGGARRGVRPPARVHAASSGGPGADGSRGLPVLRPAPDT